MAFVVSVPGGTRGSPGGWRVSRIVRGRRLSSELGEARE